MKLAVIGCGSAGTRHTRNALALGCEVTLMDTNPMRVAALREQCPQAHGSGFVIGLDEFDAIIIASPYDKHLQAAQEAVKARRPFFCEKPLGSLEQLEDWRGLLRASHGLVTQVGYQCRFHPKAKAMKLLFPPPHHGYMSTVVDIDEWPGSGYGPLLLEASHDLDLALWFGAEPVVRVARDGTAYVGDWEVRIERGRCAYQRVWQLWYPESDGGARVLFTSSSELGDQMYVDELDHFLTCVREGRPTNVPLADGLRVLEVVAQIEQMAKVQA